MEDKATKDMEEVFTIGALEDFLNEAAAALDNVAELCEGGRQSVNAIGEAIRQVDVDAASAITRGHFMTIAEFSKEYARRLRNRFSNRKA